MKIKKKVTKANFYCRIFEKKDAFMKIKKKVAKYDFFIAELLTML